MLFAALSGFAVSFKVYDIDGNGFITRDELSNVLMVLAPDDETPRSDQPARLEAVFEAMDTNMDGLISYEEFRVCSCSCHHHFQCCESMIGVRCV